MRFITAVTTFLAVGFASASPAPAVGADVQANAARAESGLSDILSQTKDIKSLVQTDLDKCKLEFPRKIDVRTHY